jgi:hypothetical protein
MLVPGWLEIWSDEFSDRAKVETFAPYVNVQTQANFDIVNRFNSADLRHLRQFIADDMALLAMFDQETQG